MSTLVDQLPALLGVAVGAIATYATTSLGERSRWRRQRDARWDEARMRAYADYAQAVKKVFYLCLRIGVARGLPHSSEPLEPDQETMELLSRAEAERAGVWESVLLMGDPDTVAAARRWHQTIWHLLGFAQGRLEGADGWQAAIDASAQARDRFYASARRDLGVRGEAVMTLPWTPEWEKDASSRTTES